MHPDARQVYLRLLRHALPYRRVFLLALLAMVVLAATEPAIPALLKPTFDGSFTQKDLGTVGEMAVLLVVLFAVRGAATYYTSIGLAWVASRVVMDLRMGMFERLLSLPAARYDGYTSGTLISKVTYDAAQVTDAATNVITVLVRDSLAVTGLLALMLYLNWHLTVIALVAAPIVVVVVRYFSRRLRRVAAALQASMGEVTHVLQETIEGQRVVRSFGGQDYERERFHGRANRVRKLEVKFAAAAAANAPVAQLVTALGLASMLYLAAMQSTRGAVSVGTFVSFFAAMAMLFAPIKRLTGVNGRLQRGIAAAGSVFALVDEGSEPETGTRTLERARGTLELRDVHFRYPTAAEDALRGVTLTVRTGETVALVGPSGSGKTTIASLLLRFYQPRQGSILLDGVPIEELTLASLRAQMALVSQDIVLFNGTVAENIAYGPLASCPRERVVEAARAAAAFEFVEALPKGFDTQVGEKGVRLSGGQRQRLAIARAFLKDAPVLVMDEATSSLDSASEREIQGALGRLREGRTTIVIAHRLSTIEDADRIVVMNEGRIVDVGTHRELLETSSLYAGLYRFQFRGETPRASAAGAQ